MGTSIPFGFGDGFWTRASEPRAAAARIVLFFGLYPAIWAHSWAWTGLLVVAMATSFWWFGTSDRRLPLLDKVIAGLRLWMSETGAGLQAPFYATSLLVTGALVWALWTHQFAAVVGLTVLAMVAKLAFLAYVVGLADRHARI